MGRVALCLVLYSAFGAINVTGVLLAAVDKKLAQTHTGRPRRVSHNTFRLWALLGAAPGLLATMYSVRHKTRRKRFLTSLSLLGLIGLAVWAYLLWSTGCLGL